MYVISIFTEKLVMFRQRQRDRERQRQTERQADR